MSVLRQENWLGQQRIDVPHLRATESSICADFDLLAGRVMAGLNAMVVSGFELITTGAVGSPATSLQVLTASSVLLHPLASEAGTIFSVPANRATETLGSSNPRLNGSFTANATNYIGIDLRRAPDASTSDLVQFLDPNTGSETPKSVPLARTLDYVLVVSTQDFSSTPGIAPIAKVVTDVNNVVTTIVDARQMLFRLGTGGSIPNIFNAYTWPGGRSEPAANNNFSSADKAIGSMKDWVDAIMTRVWDLGGGEHWFSATADRNVKMVRTGSAFTNGEWFEWTGTNLHWKGLKFVFENSTATFNDIADQTGDSAGLTDLADGDCVYVDLDRKTNRTGGTALAAIKTTLATLGSPATPGTRFIIAWRVGSVLFSRDTPFPVGATFMAATNAALGLVKLSVVSGAPSSPRVFNLDANNALSVGVAQAISGNNDAITAVGGGTGAGANLTGGATGNALVTSAILANDSPQALTKDSAGNVRSVTDHIGYRLGRICEFRELWVSLITNLANNSYTGQWQVNRTANTSNSNQEGDISPSLVTQFSGACAIGNYQDFATAIQLLTPFDYCSIAFEWEMKLDVGTHHDFTIGLTDYITGGGTPTNGYDQCAFYYHAADGHWTATTGNGTTVTKGNPAGWSGFTATTLRKFRFELHGASSPYGNKARFWVDGVLFETTATLPRNNSNLFFAIQSMATSNAQASTLNVYAIEGAWNRFASTPII